MLKKGFFLITSPGAWLKGTSYIVSVKRKSKKKIKPLKTMASK